MKAMIRKMQTCALLGISVVSMTWPATSAIAGDGTNTGGGGDASEARVSEIRADILKWIADGGAQGLKLPKGVTLQSYEREMSRVLMPQAVIVGFVTSKQESETTDPEQKVLVDGQPKTCRGFVSVSDHRPHILCNTERFAATGEAEQYRLVHHEYAGLAGVEQNVGAASDYFVSDQLSEYLEPRTILKLAVKKGSVKRAKAIRGIFGRYRLVTDLGGDLPCSERELISWYPAQEGQIGPQVSISENHGIQVEVDKSFWQGIMDKNYVVQSGSVGRRTRKFEHIATDTTILLNIEAEDLWNSGSEAFERAFYKDQVTAISSYHCSLNRKTGLMTFSEKVKTFDLQRGTSNSKTRSCLMQLLE